MHSRFTSALVGGLLVLGVLGGPMVAASNADPIRCDGRIATIVGTAKGDRLVGTNRADVIHGMGGDDTVFAMGGNDVVCGGGGADLLVGGDGADRVIGGRADDVIHGGRQRDHLRGSKGDDVIRAGDGRDVVDGGAGTDACTAGEVVGLCEVETGPPPPPPPSTSGRILFVSPRGSNSNPGTSTRPLGTISRAIADARPGDTIRLLAGDYGETIVTTKSGRIDAPITIAGPTAARVRGGYGNTACSNVACALQVSHDHWVFNGFTIDGRSGNGLFLTVLAEVKGTGGWNNNRPNDGPEGVTLSNLTLRNSGTLCLKIRWFASNIVVRDNLIDRCGRRSVPGGNRVGEGIYIGAEPTTVEQFNPGGGLDRTRDVTVIGNVIDIGGGSECVEIKPGARHNLVAENDCSRADYGAGIRVKGSNNVVRDNVIHDLVGTTAGVVLGSSNGWGTDNTATRNTIRNAFAGVRVREIDQASICGNRAISVVEALAIDGRGPFTRPQLLAAYPHAFGPCP